MPHSQIFNDTFESTWKDFDAVFRKNLLEKIQQLGSLHRLTLDHEALNREFGQRFYEALEETLKSERSIDKWKAALHDPIPTNFDEMAAAIDRHAVFPLHAFYLLLVYVHEYPLRAFFSARDRRLPFNTLMLSFEQRLSDPLPTAVDYELDNIQLAFCPGLAANPSASTNLPLAASDARTPEPLQNGGNGGIGKHPQHHWRDLRWYWHF
jgi:hypothetical protein